MLLKSGTSKSTSQQGQCQTDFTGPTAKKPLATGQQTSANILISTPEQTLDQNILL